MFPSFNTGHLLEGMARSKTIQGLGLEIPLENMMLNHVLLGATNFIMLRDAGGVVAKTEIASVYDQLRSSNIAGLDLATAPQSTRSSDSTTLGPLFVSQSSPGQDVKIMDIAGSTIFIANPVNFLAIPSHHDMKVGALRASFLSGEVWAVLPGAFQPPPPEIDTAAMSATPEHSINHDDAAEFTLFSELPGEIQAKIWVAAADNCEGRVIVANEVRY